MSVRQSSRTDPKTGKKRSYWIVDLCLGRDADGSERRVRRVPRVQTRRGAEQFERELLGQGGVVQESIGVSSRKEGRQGEAEKVKRSPKLVAFAGDFLSKYAEANNKPSEIQSKRTILNMHLIPALKQLRLDEVGGAEIEGYKSDKLRTGLSAKTVNNHLIVLRRLLGLAQEWGALDRVPKVKWLKVPEAEFDFLDFEEAERLIAAAEGEWRVMILMAVRTGLRQGELLALRWTDVDLVAGHLVVRQSVTRGIVTTPKSGRSRKIPLAPSLLAALKSHRHLRGKLVFCAGEGRMLTKNECKHPLWRACKGAGLRQIGWHVLRHTFASHLVMRGAPFKAVQEMLGHWSIEMTMRYAHLSPDARRDAVGLLDLTQTSRQPDGNRERKTGN
jgi:integrase